MGRQPVGDPDPRLAGVLEGVDYAPIDEDVFELEHVEFLRHHPGFVAALDRLREDLQKGGVEWSPHLVRAAIADPHEMPYPARVFAEEWGLSIAAVFYLTLTRLSGPETEWIAVEAMPLEYIIRIPRPISPARRDALIAWLKSKKEPGPTEEAWDVADKRRYDLSPETVAALAWFDRWNAGEEPAAIFRDLRPSERQDFETFHSRLVSAWERMRQISPDGIREDRPSKAPA